MRILKIKPQNIVTNMENRFPAMLVLWLGREFYSGKYGMTAMPGLLTLATILAIGDKFGDLGDKSKIPEHTIIFSISLLGEEIRLNVGDDSM
ncbi:hypothetical protein AVEN_94521-1 [Araneus ventricosus]|uniref:Uncharacterized protein n=1 Tax=Araneus ventricosus TaxID=182803 RepID=A0A4Y2FWZ4_ARAVE|nr:hypothetical protein AVEN_94521-1 [Araneus ventricosus]